MLFVGIFGIRDSLRDGVKEAVRKWHESQVKVIMITGDNIVTATAIAKECNIFGNNVNLSNLSLDVIEQDPESIKDNSRKREYINQLIQNKSLALTGNSFYNCVGGLICEICKKDTNLCKCPETEAKAKEIKKIKWGWT